MIERLDAKAIIVDTAFDADRLRKVVAIKRATAVILLKPQTQEPRAALPQAPSGRMLHWQAQAFPPRWHPLREDGRNFPAFVTSTAIALYVR